MKELALQIETGRLQVGVGDQDFAREDALRKEYSAARRARARRSCARSARSPNAQVDAAFQRVARDRGGARPARPRDRRDRRRARRTTCGRCWTRRAPSSSATARSLASLEGESEEVVGGIALDNYRKVRQRFYDLVLRADVGVIDVSWAVREEHRMRGEALSRERARALKALEDEYRDIMDEQRGSEP